MNQNLSLLSYIIIINFIIILTTSSNLLVTYICKVVISVKTVPSMYLYIPINVHTIVLLHVMLSNIIYLNKSICLDLCCKRINVVACVCYVKI